MTIRQTPSTNVIKRSLGYFELAGLVIIALATVYAGALEVVDMISLRKVSLGDLLLLFLYLEVLAMVAIYLESGKLPIRLPLYIAIIAMARYLILDMKEMTEWEMLAVGVTIVLIALAILALRFGSLRFPSNDRIKSRPKTGILDSETD